MRAWRDDGFKSVASGSEVGISERFSVAKDSDTPAAPDVLCITL